MQASSLPSIPTHNEGLTLTSRRILPSVSLQKGIRIVVGQIGDVEEATTHQFRCGGGKYRVSRSGSVRWTRQEVNEPQQSPQGVLVALADLGCRARNVSRAECPKWRYVAGGYVASRDPATGTLTPAPPVHRRSTSPSQSESVQWTETARRIIATVATGSLELPSTRFQAHLKHCYSFTPVTKFKLP